MSDGPQAPTPSVPDLERIHRELEEIDARVAAEEAAILARGFGEALDADLEELCRSEGPLFDALPLPPIPPRLVEPVLEDRRLYGLLAAPIGDPLPLWWSFIPGVGRPAGWPGSPVYRRTFLALFLDDRGVLLEGDVVHDSTTRLREPRLLVPRHPPAPGEAAVWTGLLPHGRTRELRGLRPFDPEGWLQRAGACAPPLPEFLELLHELVHAALTEAREALRAHIEERLEELDARRRRLSEIREGRTAE